MHKRSFNQTKPIQEYKHSSTQVPTHCSPPKRNQQSDESNKSNETSTITASQRWDYTPSCDTPSSLILIPNP
ncbi:hypothetical protein EX30DRAFT_344719 [Ascodesmis nigricans]|uniref:Uncharacterized protein n=1 Tax=Ascodesmis nigricans TaxID=341454 RepID=A0A4S2MIC8_9PEZI|nr:hypothetical protein EX30DRAFT_344719 [Ascodesmis nigricans]